MHVLYHDYYWQNGVPKGSRPTADPCGVPCCYKIVVDPYHKRYSVERYVQMRFDGVVYDSLLLDFRHLKPAEHVAWQRESLLQTSQESSCLIRNQEERVVYRETLRFEENFCRECQINSPQGTPLSFHRMFYTALSDPFNGVLLYDSNRHLVMAKRYSIDSEGTFSDLLDERWDMRDPSFLDQWGFSNASEGLPGGQKSPDSPAVL